MMNLFNFQGGPVLLIHNPQSTIRNLQFTMSFN